MYDKDFILEKVDVKYDTIKGMDMKRTITINDVIANNVVQYYPEESPEYMATYRDMGNKIMKIETDMSDFDNHEKVTYYHY